MFILIRFLYLFLGLFLILDVAAANEAFNGGTIIQGNRRNEAGISYFILKKNGQVKNSNETISLIASGDIRVTTIDAYNNIKRMIEDDPKNSVVDLLNTRDIIIGNLEMTLLDQQTAKKNRFHTANLEWINVIKDLNFTALNLANNHFQFDGREIGVRQSLDVLKKYDIKTFGLGDNFLLIEKKGIKIGLLGFAKCTNNHELPEEYRAGDFMDGTLVETVHNYQGLVDHLIVMMHWGELRIKAPNPKEEKIARDILNAGASIVIGSGPHVTQRVDVHDGKVVAFSLGNFLFNKLGNEDLNIDASKTFVLEFRISKEEIESVYLYPLNTNVGMIGFPDSTELNSRKNYIENLYKVDKNHYIESIPIFKKIKGRIKAFAVDFTDNPVRAFRKHIKTRYIFQAFYVIYEKTKILWIVFGILSCSIFMYLFFIKSIRFRTEKFKLNFRNPLRNG